MSNLLSVSWVDFSDILEKSGLSCDGLDRAGSHVYVKGLVTEENRALWEYLEKGLLYKSHLQRYEDPSVLVEASPLFKEIGSPVIWSDESQIHLDLFYKVKLTLEHDEVRPKNPLVPELLDDRLWKMSCVKLRKICASMKLKSTGNKRELISRIRTHLVCNNFLCEGFT